MMKIGWIGLGSIGTAMALKALASGHEVTAYARGAGKDEVAAAGARLVASYAEVAADCDVLGICVFKDAQVSDVLLEQGVLAAMRPGSVVLIHTTGSPELMRRIGATAPVGVSVLDATFSGTAADVTAGRLAIMTGGDEQPLQRALPLLQAYSGKIHHVGALGQGQLVKLLNNLLFAANLQNATEVMKMAEQLQLDPLQCAGIIQDCSGASYASNLFAQFPIAKVAELTRDYLVKDVATALATAREQGVDTDPFAPTAAYFAAAR